MNITIKELSTIELSDQLKQKSFFYHSTEWKEFITKSFNTEQLWVTATDDTNTVITALPITKIRSKIFGSRIIATGYQEYGGFIGDKDNLNKIIEYIKEKYSNEFEFLEIKGSIDGTNNPNNNPLLRKVNHYKRFVLSLKKSTQEKDPLNVFKDQAGGAVEAIGDPKFSGPIWDNIQKSKRKAINKAKKECTCRELNIKDLDQFYKLYLQNMRRFGTPPYSKHYFHNFFNKIEEKGFGRIYGCFKDNKLISALLGFTYNRTVHITTAISNTKFAKYRPSDLMHWKFINWALENNYKSFDFGLVREESGQFEYKRKWGAELKELPSYYLLLSKKEVPTILDPTNKKYKLAIKVWQHLPIKLTEWIGMRIRRELGM